ncbi:MAG: hypothetical protein PVI04_05615 [Anaerolineales bacterium]|jgi:hypothetical protein
MADGRTNRTSLIFGVLLIGLGALFLVGQLFRVNIWQYAWPMFILVPGIIFFGITMSGGSNSAGFAIPASILTTVGLIFFFQALTGHYASWAYAWTLIFPTAVGLGLFIMGSQGGDESLKKQGKGFLRAGLVLFVILAFVFEAIFRMGNNLFSRLFWPSAIILLGVYLILRQTGIFGASKASVEPPEEVIDVEEVPSVHGEDEDPSEGEG